VLAARDLTVEGLACLTCLSQLQRLAVWGCSISFDDASNSDRSDSDKSDSNSEGQEFEDLTLTNTVCGQEPQTSHS
jgi:hypothetical protein